MIKMHSGRADKRRTPVAPLRDHPPSLVAVESALCLGRTGLLGQRLLDGSEDGLQLGSIIDVALQQQTASIMVCMAWCAGRGVCAFQAGPARDLSWVPEDANAEVELGGRLVHLLARRDMRMSQLHAHLSTLLAVDQGAVDGHLEEAGGVGGSLIGELEGLACVQ